ncbi:hypothetical protein SLA2020_308650 [Shorea laevis]
MNLGYVPTFSDSFRTTCGEGNGYISPCAGDTHPPVFRSPIGCMEDVMAIEVICCMHRLPRAHKHIIRPPAGVIFPPKVVQLSDLKPEPALWHEDSRRKPWENRRQNPPGTVSGNRLEEASHRLLVNNLQLKVDHNGFGIDIHAPPPAYANAPHVSPVNPYANYGFHNHGQPKMVSPVADYSNAGHHMNLQCLLCIPRMLMRMINPIVLQLPTLLTIGLILFIREITNMLPTAMYLSLQDFIRMVDQDTCKGLLYKYCPQRPAVPFLFVKAVMMPTRGIHQLMLVVISGGELGPISNTHLEGMATISEVR